MKIARFLVLCVLSMMFCFLLRTSWHSTSYRYKHHIYTKFFNPVKTNISIDILLFPNTTSMERVQSSLYQRMFESLDKTVFAAVSVDVYANHSYAQFTNSTEKDYYRVTIEGKQRLLLKSLFEYNSSIEAFVAVNQTDLNAHWNRSKFLECKNMNMKRKNNSRAIALDDLQRGMTEVRDILLNNAMVPILVFGTALGWYRECTVIPHTTDVDFAVRIEELQADFVNNFSYPSIDLRRVLGIPASGFELTLDYSTSLFSSYSLDIFFLYNMKNYSWTGGTDNDGVQFKFYLPKLEELCSVDLVNSLFWVPCNVVQFIEALYGTEWREDIETDNYGWNEGANMSGTFSPEDIKKMKFY